MIIGTRGSDLALAQAKTVEELLDSRGFPTTRKIIKTSGDNFTDRPLHEVEGVGAFVRELDDRMFSGEIDIAVHSMKDLPTERPAELSIAAVIERDSPHDILLTNDGSTLDELPEKAIVGTTSMRRRAQFLRYRPDLDVQDLRGNINTRLKKLESGMYDGIILAEAGLQRMGWDIECHRLDADSFCPSANQGTIAVVTLAGGEAELLCSQIDHAESRIATEVERLVIRDVEGGCIVPVGSFAEFVDNGNTIHIRAEILSLDGKRDIRLDEMIPVDNYREHAKELGQKLVARGGKELVKEAISQISPKNN